MRIQVREDGLSIDQIVLSPTTYVTRSPGALKNDTTILTARRHAAAVGITLVREPYLQQVTRPARGDRVGLARAGPGARGASAGRDIPAVSRALSAAARTGLAYDYYQHEATITGLSPATTLSPTTS